MILLRNAFDCISFGVLGGYRIIVVFLDAFPLTMEVSEILYVDL